MILMSASSNELSICQGRRPARPGHIRDDHAHDTWCPLTESMPDLGLEPNRPPRGACQACLNAGNWAPLGIDAPVNVQ